MGFLSGTTKIKAGQQNTDKKNIVLLGPPNSGKTTLFNCLTGFKNKTVNYPGSTIGLSQGDLLKKYKLSANITDTPGIYSLFPQSKDEEITRDFIFDNDKLSALILVLDSGKLEVQLPLFFQLKSAGYPVLLALSMWDLLPPKSMIDIPQLEKLLDNPVLPLKGFKGEGLENIVKKLKPLLLNKKPVVKKLKTWNQKKMDELLKKSQKIVQKSRFKKSSVLKDSPFFSNKWDRLFLHPKIGLLLFAFIMFGFFSSIFWLATPFMDLVDQIFAFLIEKSYQALSFQPYLADFISQVLLTSLGSVLVFVPQVFILFVGISLLEDSGYLARAVALMDGPLSKIGLSGRSFPPLLSGYACAIPAVLLARNLKSTREKLMVFFVMPLMTCSARLPVYALLLSFLFYGQSSWKPGLFLSLIYIISFILGMAVVSLFNLFLKKEKRKVFLLDLPLYRRPLLKKVLKNASWRTKHYITKAGPAIFTVALVIGLLIHFPVQPDLSPAERIQQSYASQIGQKAEPLFTAIGVDWRVGTALISAFAAREVFVSALVLLFNVTEGKTEGLTHSLLENMKSAQHFDGSPIWTTASVISIIVFFMLALQCLSTSAIVYKESGSLKFAVIQFLAFNTMAYLIAVLCYQSLTWIL